ncbi:hypothetical protein ABFG93_11315 [Pseudalkalibacillus hwajinpoensis]
MARLNPQDVGAPEDETFLVSTEGAKQPEDLARGAKRTQAFRNGDIGTHT